MQGVRAADKLVEGSRRYVNRKRGKGSRDGIRSRARQNPEERNALVRQGDVDAKARIKRKYDGKYR